MSVSFFCTRCRHLLTYEDSTSGSIIYCPFCQQAVIVPALWPQNNEPQDLSPIEIPSDGQASEEIPLENNACVETGISIAAEPVSLLPLQKNTEEPSQHSLEATPPVRRVLSDGEFLALLQNSPSFPADCPPVQYKRTSAKTSLANPSDQPPQDCLRRKKFFGQRNRRVDDGQGALSPASNLSACSLRFYGLIFVFCLLFSAGILGYFFKNGERKSLFYRANSDPQEKTSSSLASNLFFFDGQLTWQTPDLRNVGDGGSLVVLIPSDFIPEKQLIVTPLSPQRAETELPLETRQILENHGGICLRADTQGEFGVYIPPNRYFVLLISAHVSNRLTSTADETSSAISEIERYFYRPDRTLLNNASFLWEERELNRTHCTLNHQF